MSWPRGCAISYARHSTSAPFVDTGPVLERELAAAAGLGWIGKNTMLLDRQHGCNCFLGELITTLDLVPDAPVADHCGTCTRCLDACPTGAFPAPYQLDASRCISYLTIEHRGQIPAEYCESIGDWVFGCDICQNVCPFNRKAPPGTHPELASERVPARLGLLELLILRSGAYRRLTSDSAVRRARRNMLRRNAAIALGNRPKLSANEWQALRDATTDDDEAIADAAQQALRKQA